MIGLNSAGNGVDVQQISNSQAKTVREVEAVQPTNLLPQTHSRSLHIASDTSFEDWQNIGRELAAREKVLNWWIGDWWAFGEHNYGDRAKVAAEGLFKQSFGTLRNIGTVSTAFPATSRQHDGLTFTHHQEVAPIARRSPEAAEMLLSRAECEGMSVAQVRAAVRTLQGREIEPRPAPDDDSILSGFLRHWNRLPFQVRLSAAELIAEADGAEIEPA